MISLFAPHKHKPLLGENFPSFDQNYVVKGATDVGDLSQLVPVSMLLTTCFPTGSPGHSWANVATGGMSIGHKGMMHAAKIMALAALDLYADPEHLRKARLEFDSKAAPYSCPIPADKFPPRYRPED